MEEKQEALDILFGENNEKLMDFKEQIEYDSLPDVLKSPINSKSEKKKIKEITKTKEEETISSHVIEEEQPITKNSVDEKITKGEVQLFDNISNINSVDENIN